MRLLAEWDADYLDELGSQEETATFEKKAADGLTREKIAQGVCAFANSGDGFMAFGMKDERAGGGLDAGVPSTKGRQSVKDWIEALIPTLHQPPIQGCEARFIQHASHASDKGVLVVAVPLSERRPHWVEGDDKAYIRVGAHSAQMPTQVFADMLTRGSVPRVSVADLGLTLNGAKSWVHHKYDGFTFPINPILYLESGPICEVWACEIRETQGVGEFRSFLVSIDPENIGKTHSYFVRGVNPLFPGRRTKIINPGIDLRLCLPHGSKHIEIALQIYAASAPPIERRYAFSLDNGMLTPL